MIVQNHIVDDLTFAISTIPVVPVAILIIASLRESSWHSVRFESIRSVGRFRSMRTNARAKPAPLGDRS